MQSVVRCEDISDIDCVLGMTIGGLSPAGTSLWKTGRHAKDAVTATGRIISLFGAMNTADGLSDGAWDFYNIFIQ